MRIGIICHAGYGGSAKIALQLALYLYARHNIHIFTIRKPYFCEDIPENENLIFHNIPLSIIPNLHPAELMTSWPNDVYNKFLEELIISNKSEEFDVLHFHYAVPFAQLAVTLKHVFKKRPPIIVGTFHGTDVSRHELFEKDLKPILSQVDALTVVSRSYAKLAKIFYSLPNEPIVIPNFVNLQEFYADPHCAKLAHEPFKIYHVSNFRPVKNALRMVKIFFRIHEKIPARLCLIGEGPDLPLVKEFCVETGIERDVEFLGLKPHIHADLKQADLLLVSSNEESFCLSALEAMALGVPIIAPAIGGLRELIVSGKQGFLYPVDDIDGAAESAVNLLCNQKLYEECCLQSQERAREFAQESIIPRYEKLYDDLLMYREKHN